VSHSSTITRIVAVSSALGLLAPVATGGPAAAREPAAAPPQTRHVVLVDWDGFDPSYLGRTPTPALDALRERGSLSFAASTFRAISNPARASLSTGSYPATHHNSAFVYDPAANAVTGQNRTIDAESIAQSVTRQGGRIASAGWYIVENKGAFAGNPYALWVPGADCAQNTDNAVRIIRGEPVSSGGTEVVVPEMPNLLAVYCSDLDSIGHRAGPRSPEIAPALAALDAHLGRIVAATRAAGVYDQTTFIVLSDHGMTEFSRTMHDDLLARLAAAGFRAEILVRGRSAQPETEVILAENERAAAVYLRGSAATPQARLRLRQIFATQPQIARVQDRLTLTLMRVAPAEGEFVLEARAPWSFVPPAAMPPAGTEKGAHSTLDEIFVPFFIAGGDVRRGAIPILPRTVDVAPTISALLGLAPPASAEGRILREVLR
jgi:arylsulfatase A-like enzyme